MKDSASPMVVRHLLEDENGLKLTRLSRRQCRGIRHQTELDQSSPLEEVYSYRLRTKGCGGFRKTRWMEGKGLPRYWCHCRRRPDCSQPFPSFLRPLDKFLMTQNSNNTSIPGSGISSQLALKRRFDFAIRLEQIVQAVALYGRCAFSASITQTWWLDAGAWARSWLVEVDGGHVDGSHRGIELRGDLVNMETVEIAACSKGERRGIICRGPLAALGTKAHPIPLRATQSLRCSSEAS
jgi:hypothetical protein